MFESGVRGQYRVVGFHDRVGHGRSRVHAEFKFRFLAIIGGQSLHEKSTETGASSPTEGVEDEKALKS